MLLTYYPSPCSSQLCLRLASDKFQILLGQNAAGVVERRYKDGILAFRQTERRT